MKQFVFYAQRSTMDCGPTCLRMVARWYGKTVPEDLINEWTAMDEEGTTLGGLQRAAEKIGFTAIPAHVSLDEFRSKNLPLPAIVHWRTKHYVVLLSSGKNRVTLADPADGIKKMPVVEFVEGWIGTTDRKAPGVILLLEPDESFLP